MLQLDFPTTAGALSSLLGAELIGDAELPIKGISPLSEAQEGSLTFCSDRKYLSEVRKLKNVTLLVPKEFLPIEAPITVLLVENPKKQFIEVSKKFIPKNPWSGISDLAHIDPSVVMGEGVSVGPFAVLSEGARIGDHTIIYPHAYIGPNTVIGKHCEIHSNVALIANVEIFDNVKIFAGSVLGSDGFGFLEGDAQYTAIPQVGKVVIESDVRIGAKCTIDRSTFGETRVGQGTKIDDQVHVGHNCKIGRNCILCAQVGLAGSTTLEDNVILAGQVGLGGHLTVGKGAMLGGQTGAASNLKPGEKYFGSPATPLRDSLRVFRYTQKLPELFARVKKIETLMSSSASEANHE